MLNQASKMRARLDEIEGEIAALQAERSFLRKWTGGATQASEQAENGQKPAVARERIRKGQGITSAIISLIEQEPGILASKATDRIAKEAETSSEDPRRLISNTIYILKTKGRIRRTPAGRLYPPRKEEADT